MISESINRDEQREAEVEPSEIFWIYPGQGENHVGKGADLYKYSPAAREVFDKGDEVMGMSLSQVCFKGPQGKLDMTENGQPANLIISLATSAACREKNPEIQPGLVAAHSIGEYAALVDAGIITLEQAILLVKERGRLTALQAAKEPGGMVAFLGVPDDLLADICAKAHIAIANFNCPGQRILSGLKDNLSYGIEYAQEKGVKLKRMRPLDKISGAFHTKHMTPVQNGLRDFIAAKGIKFLNPKIPFVANATLAEVSSGKEAEDAILANLVGPVNWEQEMAVVRSKGFRRGIEMGASVLSDFFPRIGNGITGTPITGFLTIPKF